MQGVGGKLTDLLCRPLTCAFSQKSCYECGKKDSSVLGVDFRYIMSFAFWCLKCQEVEEGSQD